MVAFSTMVWSSIDSENSMALLCTAAKATTVASTSSWLEGEIHSLVIEFWKNIGL